MTPEDDASGDSAELTASAADQSTGDPADGKQVFTRCADCHSVEEGDHRVGPSLSRIFRRSAGAIDGFGNYSPAMKEAGFEWSEAKLRKFIKAPQEMVSGTNMTFRGIKSDGRIDDLIAYLRRATAVD